MTKATEKKVLAQLRLARKERRELREDVDNLAIATKNGFDTAQGESSELRDGVLRVEEKQDALQDNQERLERGVKAILEVVQENNILLKVGAVR